MHTVSLVPFSVNLCAKMCIRDRAYTAFDTIDGNKDYKVDAKAEILANGQAVEATVTVDLRVLASYFLGDSQADDVLTAAQAALLRSALSNVKLELLCNADSGDLYLKCPAVAKILAIDERCV